MKEKKKKQDESLLIEQQQAKELVKYQNEFEEMVTRFHDVKNAQEVQDVLQTIEIHKRAELRVILQLLLGMGAAVATIVLIFSNTITVTNNSPLDYIFLITLWIALVGEAILLANVKSRGNAVRKNEALVISKIEEKFPNDIVNFLKKKPQEVLEVVQMLDKSTVQQKTEKSKRKNAGEDERRSLECLFDDEQLHLAQVIPSEYLTNEVRKLGE